VVAIGASRNDGNGTLLGYVRVNDLSVLLSVEEVRLFNFNLNPNPVKNEFTIQLNNTTQLENVNIYNNLGQLILSSKETTIDSSKLTFGLYIVEIETTKGKDSKNIELHSLELLSSFS